MVPIARQRQTTRLETFVDAAFAASFLITVMFWLGHYRWSRRYGVEDTGSVVLSLALVFLMLVFLYPLRLMASGAFYSVSGGWLPGEIAITRISQLQFMFLLYGIGFMSMAGVLLALYARVLRVALSPPLSVEDRAVAVVEVQAWGILAGMGALSALLTLVLPPRQIGYAVWIYASLAVVMPVMSARWKRSVERAVADGARDSRPD